MRESFIKLSGLATLVTNVIDRLGMKSTATIMMFQSSRIFLFYKGSQNTYVYNKIVVRVGLVK